MVRFPQMLGQDVSSLVAFQRQLDLLLTYPALAALMVAPGCSINLRELMDGGGILLAGISAKDGEGPRDRRDAAADADDTGGAFAHKRARGAARRAGQW